MKIKIFATHLHNLLIVTYYLRWNSLQMISDWNGGLTLLELLFQNDASISHYDYSEDAPWNVGVGGKRKNKLKRPRVHLLPLYKLT